MNKAFFSLLLALVIKLGQSEFNGNTEFFSAPNVTWDNENAASAVGIGNGLFMSPDDSTLVGAFADGSLRFYDALSGTERIDVFVPSATNNTEIRGLGGATFSNNYVVYAVTLANTSTRVIALDMLDGSKIFESEPLPGVQAGTPQTTSDGRFVMITHNVDQSTGYFSILDTSQVVTDVPLAPVYQTMNETNPFSPVGVYHNPERGFYTGGENNMNDMFVWAFDTEPNESDLQNTQVGIGQMFGFQMPTNGSNMSSFLLGDKRDFQASTAPVLTNSGKSLYWAVTRAQQWCWTGQERNNKFDQGRTAAQGFTRAERPAPKYISSRAGPSLSSDTVQPTVYGPGVVNELFRMNYNYSEVITVNTSDTVSSKVLVSPDDLFIYYATNDGLLVQANGTTLQTVWQKQLPSGVRGELAMNSFGTMVYVPGTDGRITAFQVAQVPVPQVPRPPLPATPQSPLPTTSTVPSSVPSYVPTVTVSPTDGPKDGPSEAPSDIPSDIPSDMPSDTPSDVPSDVPSSTPSSITNTTSALPTVLVQDETDRPTSAVGTIMSSPSSSPTTPKPGGTDDTESPASPQTTSSSSTVRILGWMSVVLSVAYTLFL